MLHLSNLTKTYPGGIKAMDDVNLDIPRGMFGLLGPNGAGKSTLMRTVATLQSPDDGTITFNGIDVLSEKMKLRQRLGYLPQEFGAYPRTSAQVMLEHFAALKGIHGQQRKHVVENLLIKTNLWNDRKRSVSKFSGGMKQRYGIAQALIGEPGLIIVDEPTAGLDPAERRRFQNLLAEIGEEVVVILSTHIVDDVEELCPRLAIMGHGRILRQGVPDELIAELNGKLWSLETSRKDLSLLKKKHTVISARIKNRALSVRLLAEEKPEGAVRISPELEDVYFATLLKHGLTANLDLE